MYAAPEQEAVNAAATVTIPAPAAGISIVLKQIDVSYSAAPTGGSVTVTDGATVDDKFDVTVAGQTNIPLPAEGLQCGAGNQVTVTLAAGGAGITGRVNVGYDLQGTQ